MNYEEAIARLRLHASLGMEGGEEAGSSFTYSIWDFQKHGRDHDFGRLFVDIVDCLDVINLHTNGPHPSTRGPRSYEADYRAAQAIAYIVGDGLDVAVGRFAVSSSPFFASVIAPLLWGISRGWGAVLDGDFDSISEMLLHEASAREIDSVVALLSPHASDAQE